MGKSLVNKLATYFRNGDYQEVEEQNAGTCRRTKCRNLFCSFGDQSANCLLFVLLDLSHNCMYMKRKWSCTEQLSRWSKKMMPMAPFRIVLIASNWIALACENSQ
ncbi:uncharacterized protein [Malus domestica]|uniref:uncharacterized protein isoform X3 n=1 Tax=Malus domestica TaxID=3750 RepID=UPI0039756D34